MGKNCEDYTDGSKKLSAFGSGKTTCTRTLFHYVIAMCNQLLTFYMLLCREQTVDHLIST